MNDNYEFISAALENWATTLDRLISHLTAEDEDASKDAVFILLIQGLGSFEGPVMELFFPVLDAIKKRIDERDLNGALRQALLFRKQLDEVMSMVAAGPADESE